MVGVRGKYKGCETCRLRRVKCDNARPLCRKCLDSDRKCAGYERDTVFIIGTQEDGGRCASHPPRVIKSKKNSISGPSRGSRGSVGSRSPSVATTSPASPSHSNIKHSPTTPQPMNLSHALFSSPIPMQPFRPAWDDTITLLSGGMVFNASFAVLQTPIQSLVRQLNVSSSGSSGAFAFSPFPQYDPVGFRPTLQGVDFQLHSQCLVHLVSPAISSHTGAGAAAADNIFLVLYEHHAEPWEYPVASHSIQQQGPGQFMAFPAHHFFARVHRPTAIFAALLSRENTFLAEPEWNSVPWGVHPKSWFDKLLDIVTLVPALLSRTDQITPLDPTTARRLMAHDLLADCLHVEQALEQWNRSLQAAEEEAGHGLGFWVEPSAGDDAPFPFSDALVFRDSVMALMFVTYWSTLVLLYPCISSLCSVLFEPVFDAFPTMYPDLMTADPTKYSVKEVREMATNVCRSLEFARATTVQPDLLTAPLFIVEAFYQGLHATAGDGALELLWCDAFRGRLAIRGQDMANAVQSRSWMEVAQY